VALPVPPLVRAFETITFDGSELVRVMSIAADGATPNVTTDEA